MASQVSLDYQVFWTPPPVARKADATTTAKKPPAPFLPPRPPSEFPHRPPTRPVDEVRLGSWAPRVEALEEPTYRSSDIALKLNDIGGQQSVNNALDASQTHDTLLSVAALVDSVGERQPGRTESIDPEERADTICCESEESDTIHRPVSSIAQVSPKGCPAQFMTGEESPIPPPPCPSHFSPVPSSIPPDPITQKNDALPNTANALCRVDSTRSLSPVKSDSSTETRSARSPKQSRRVLEGSDDEPGGCESGSMACQSPVCMPKAWRRVLRPRRPCGAADGEKEVAKDAGRTRRSSQRRDEGSDDHNGNGARNNNQYYYPSSTDKRRRDNRATNNDDNVKQPLRKRRKVGEPSASSKNLRRKRNHSRTSEGTDASSAARKHPILRGISRPPHASMDGTHAGAVQAEFDEWELQNAFLKRTIVNGVATFQLQFDWDLCTIHGQTTRAMSRRANKPVEGVAAHAKRSNGTRGRFTQQEDKLLIRLKEELQLPWLEIHQRFTDRFAGRSKEALQVRYCTKLKCR
ncbi:hypothetical protein HIM_10765 [Hirsutella minnesotensis 3608]|uniref:Myb-like domain-containing protein n=1 Tax=Hirsutella minnesotensis 3608 TaxID=1043627 RepID=A0A0F7ZWZ6_9HYPO|nr:hypothetical protein HIM_10765 [Hirsutella minnesotensis 3608]